MSMINNFDTTEYKDDQKEVEFNHTLNTSARFYQDPFSVVRAGKGLGLLRSDDSNRIIS